MNLSSTTSILGKHTRDPQIEDTQSNKRHKNNQGSGGSQIEQKTEEAFNSIREFSNGLGNPYFQQPSTTCQLN